MEKTDNILGFSASFEHAFDESPEEEQRVEKLSEEFRSYIWGKGSLGDKFRSLKFKDYGQDIELILFQFYVFPSEYSKRNIKDVEPYRPKEKSIAVSVLITQDNFFDKTEAERHAFLAGCVLDKLDTLEGLCKRQKYDIDMAKLKQDVQNILADY